MGQHTKNDDVFAEPTPFYKNKRRSTHKTMTRQSGNPGNSQLSLDLVSRQTTAVYNNQHIFTQSEQITESY